MRYQPVTLKDRSHIGKNWNSYYLRSFQIMLQATHGVVSGNKEFFNRAYGENTPEFKRLLIYPHGFIFHRDYYQYGEGRAVMDEYMALRNRMSGIQESELLGYLTVPLRGDKAKEAHYAKVAKTRKVDKLVRDVIKFHLLGTKDDKITDARQIVPMFSALNPDPALPSEEEFVEDAGLYEPESAGKAATRSVNVKFSGKVNIAHGG